LPFDRHFRLPKYRLIALERATAGEAKYKFADGSSPPENTIIVGTGVSPDASRPSHLKRRVEVLEFDTCVLRCETPISLGVFQAATAPTQNGSGLDNDQTALPICHQRDRNTQNSHSLGRKHSRSAPVRRGTARRWRGAMNFNRRSLRWRNRIRTAESR
jgi:hypothetical protein